VNKDEYVFHQTLSIFPNSDTAILSGKLAIMTVTDPTSRYTN